MVIPQANQSILRIILDFRPLWSMKEYEAANSADGQPGILTHLQTLDTIGSGTSCWRGGHLIQPLGEEDLQLQAHQPVKRPGVVVAEAMPSTGKRDAIPPST